MRLIVASVVGSYLIYMAVCVHPVTMLHGVLIRSPRSCLVYGLGQSTAEVRVYDRSGIVS